MALTQTQVSALYVAIFNRASEGEGNQYWQDTGLPASEVADQMLATQDAQDYFGDSLDDDQAFIELIYLNTLNKTLDDDPDGIAFWVDQLQDHTRGEVVAGLVDAVYTYADSTDPVTKDAYDQFVNRVDVSNFMADTIEKAPADYAVSTSFNADLPVTNDVESVNAALIAIADMHDSTQIDVIDHTLTLKKVVNETITIKETNDNVAYWGDPDCDNCSITYEQFKTIVDDTAGIDAFGDIDINATTALTDVYISTTDNDSDAGGDSTITFTTATGEQFTSELALGEAYLDFLDSLIYYTDADGNKVSRFTNKVVTTYDQVESYSLTPIILTTSVNNGGTYETGFTTDENDLIVVGETELLHGAYIDGGGGVNTLEVDMKGVYAQPIQLLNIQNVNVQNLPNVYGDYYDLTNDTNLDGYSIPDYLDGTVTSMDSVLDLSRATSLEKLTITEGINLVSGTAVELGALTVVGVRNGAETVFEGSFIEDVNVYYGEGLGDALNVTFNLGDVADDVAFGIFHTSNTVNINSIGGGNVLSAFNFDGATLTNMNISGTAEFTVTESLAANFTTGHHAVIDASANTAGVDLNMDGFDDEVIFTGTAEANDHFSSLSDEGKAVSITGGNGDNEFDATAKTVTVVSGDGNNIINAASTEFDATITTGSGNDVVNATSHRDLTVNAGDGANEINASASNGTANITSGEGDDSITVYAQNAIVDAGDGNNVVEADGSVKVSITTGAGDDTIKADVNDATINAGDGNNNIMVDADAISITTGSGDDTVTISGAGTVGTATAVSMLDINLGAGSNTINLGDVNGYGSYDDGVTALTGSSITGENITLVVNETSNLSQAAISGVTSVVLDDSENLTLSAEQFIAIGASNFSVDGAAFGNTATLTLVVTDSMNFDDLGITGDTFACDDINLNIVLACASTEENVFTLTAEQLDTYITEDGIRVDYDNGYDNNQVVITDASLAFDAFAGGVGSINDATGTDDVTIIRSVEGYSRPTEDTLSDSMTINTDTDDVPDAIGDDTTLLQTLNIEGSQDITTTVNLGNNFNIDFSALTGTANLTVADFADMTEDADSDNWGSIVGNGTTDDPARVNVTVAEGGIVGSDDQGISVSGVQTLVVTGVTDTATIFLCETADDIETVGLQGNWGDKVTFENVAWDVDILMEAALTQKTNTYDVGSLTVNYEADDIRGTNATGVVVDINNAGVAVEDGIWVESLTVNGAEDITINASDGAVKILALEASDATSLTLTSADDVTVSFNDVNFADDFATLDASAVDGTFTLNLADTDPADYTVENIDLSDVAVSGIDAITFDGDIKLKLTADQVIELGSVITDNDNSVSILDVTGLSDQALDLSAIDVDDIGTVTTADVDGTIVLNEATNLGGADVVVIDAKTSDTALQMTVDQYHQICSYLYGTEGSTTFCSTTATYEASLILTDVAGDSVIDLSNVEQSTTTPVAVTVVLDGVTATDGMIIADGDVTLEISGDTDITNLNTAAALAGNANATAAASIVDVNFTSDATLTLTADQIVAIEAAYDAANPGSTESAFSVADGANVTVNVVDLDTQALDLDALQDAGINIGTVSITDSDAAFTLNNATTFGGADEIITPTADASHDASASPDPDAVDGIEPTKVTMTVQQFATSSGVITGDSQIDLTNLVNNVDADHDYVAEAANYDFSQIANAGTLYLGQDTVTLSDAANLGSFGIFLAGGQMIQFATEAQASGTTVTEESGPYVSAIAWLFDATTAVIDTTNYDSAINTLYVNEDLVDGVNVEALYNTLPNSITVEVVNSSDIPDVLVAYDRTVTVEALTATDGMTFDDQAEFQTTANLTINLEGNTNVGNIVIDDTVGEGTFQTLTINSYEDRSTVFLDPADDNGLVFQPNKVGDISLSTTPSNELVSVTINTYADVDNVIGTADDADGFLDAVNVNSALAERDGLAIEVGTITFASASGDNHSATLTLTGAEDITVEAIEFSDPDISMVHVDAAAFTADLTIGSDVYENATNPIDNIYLLDNYVSDAINPFTFGASADTTATVIKVVNGSIDLTEDTVTDVDSVDLAEGTTLTMTAAQVAAIGIADADLDGVADNWSGLSGATLNIVDLGSQALDLDAIEAAGVNIGTVTVSSDAELDAATTLGDADLVSIVVDDTNVSLEMTAAQYKTIHDGNIQESRTGDALTDDTIVSNVTIDALEAIETAAGDVTIDLSTVSTTGLNSLEIGNEGTAVDVIATGIPGDQDVKFTDTTDLGDFSVKLYDIDTDNVTDGLEGETIRFATEDQAGRLVEVVDANRDGDSVISDATNVVWMFTETTGAIETTYEAGVQGYDPQLGRLWVTEDLVDGQNVESFYTTLSEDIIVRIDNSNLTGQLPVTTPINRDVEISSFASMDSLEFTDDNQLEHVYNLSITLGGETDIGNLSLDNILAPVDPTYPNFPGDDEFGTLTINSYVADSVDSYLLPDDFDPATDVLPNNTAYGFDGTNVIGDISSGATRGELSNVVVNTGSGTTSAALKIQTIYFAEDDDGDDANAMFTADGASDVTVKSLDTSDPEITALTVNNNLDAGTTLTVTGGSPAFDGGDATGDTEILNIFVDADTITTFGSLVDPADVTAGVYAGISGADLSHLNIASDGIATVNLGTIARVDSDDFALAALDDVIVSMTLGTADANGVTAPTLNDGGTWAFTGVDSLTFEDSVTLGAGNLVITSPLTGGVPNPTTITIDGNVDFTTLAADDTATLAVEGLFIPYVVKIVVDGTNTVSMTDEQWITNSGNMAFVDALDAPAVLHVTSDLLTEIGSDLTEVRGYVAYDIDSGLSVTLREDQADAAYVDGSNNPGTLTGADVTVFVQETGFGDNDITNLTDVSKLVIEQDATGFDDDGDATTPDVYGYEVVMTVAQADSLVGDITKNGNIVVARTDINDDGGLDDLTDPAGNGSVAAYDLSEVDILFADDDVRVNQTQFGVANISLNGNALTLEASGDLTALNMNDATTGHIVTNLVTLGDTTITALQEAAIAGTITMNDPAADTHTLSVDAVEALGQDAVVNATGVAGTDGYIDQNSTINLDLSNVTVATVNATLDTTTTTDGTDSVDGNYTLTGDLNGATLTLTDNGTVTTDVTVANGETITGTAATLNITDATDALQDTTDTNNDDAFDFSSIDAVIAGTITLSDNSIELDPNTNLGDFTVIVYDGDYLSLTTEQANGKDITDADGTATGVTGNVTVFELGSTAVDLSGIVTDGIVNAILSSTETTVALDANTDISSVDVIYCADAGATNDHNSVVTDFTLSANQADGVTLSDNNAVLENATITNLEDQLDADLHLMEHNGDYNLNVELDSTGNVQLLAGSDLSGINGGDATTAEDQVTVSGDGMVTFADESGVGTSDGANVSTTSFVLEDGSTLQTDLRHSDADSIVDLSLVSGEGELQVVADDGSSITLHDSVKYSTVIITGNDANVTVDDFKAGVFSYDGNPTGVDAMDLNESVVTTGGTVYEETDAAAVPTAIGDDTGLLVYTGNNLASADLTGVQNLFNGTTADLDFAANGDDLYLVASNGTDSYLFLIHETDDNVDTVESAELIATLTGVADASDFIDANFDDFAQ